MKAPTLCTVQLANVLQTAQNDLVEVPGGSLIGGLNPKLFPQSPKPKSQNPKPKP
jgi:hypothetical protein